VTTFNEQKLSRVLWPANPSHQGHLLFLYGTSHFLVPIEPGGWDKRTELKHHHMGLEVESRGEVEGEQRAHYVSLLTETAP
jgi:hypothetical protein